MIHLATIHGAAATILFLVSVIVEGQQRKNKP